MRLAEVEARSGRLYEGARQLGWKPHTSFRELVRMMVDSDVELLKPGARQVKASCTSPAIRSTHRHAHSSHQPPRQQESARGWLGGIGPTNAKYWVAWDIGGLVVRGL